MLLVCTEVTCSCRRVMCAILVAVLSSFLLVVVARYIPIHPDTSWYVLIRPDTCLEISKNEKKERIRMYQDVSGRIRTYQPWFLEEKGSPIHPDTSWYILIRSDTSWYVVISMSDLSAFPLKWFFLPGWCLMCAKKINLWQINLSVPKYSKYVEQIDIIMCIS